MTVDIRDRVTGWKLRRGSTAVVWRTTEADPINVSSLDAALDPDAYDLTFDLLDVVGFEIEDEIAEIPNIASTFNRQYIRSRTIPVGPSLIIKDRGHIGQPLHTILNGEGWLYMMTHVDESESVPTGDVLVDVWHMQTAGPLRQWNSSGGGRRAVTFAVQSDPATDQTVLNDVGDPAVWDVDGWDLAAWAT